MKDFPDFLLKRTKIAFEFVSALRCKLKRHKSSAEMRKNMKQLEQLGDKLSKCRQNRNMTQEELARRLGITPQALSKWERNQSFPDISLLSDVCSVLGVSADYLLGIESQKLTENDDEKDNEEILFNLRNSLEPLELIFGEGLVHLFIDTPFVEYIVSLRKRLSKEGILMPVVRLRDEAMLESSEFMILSYQNILYSERITDVNEDTLKYIIKCLEETVRNKYADIINPDIVKCLTDNLQIKYPGLINKVVPDKISYGMLTELLRNFMLRGNSALYLQRIIEYAENALQRKPDISIEELTGEIAGRLERGDNFFVVLAARNNAAK